MFVHLLIYGAYLANSPHYIFIRKRREWISILLMLKLRLREFMSSADSGPECMPVCLTQKCVFLGTHLGVLQ